MKIYNLQFTIYKRTGFLLFIVYCLLFIGASTASAQSVDILWQGDTYTPPLYQGKSLWSTQSKIIFVAVPQGLGSASNLNFRWIKNGTVLGNISGVGRNTISFVDSVLSQSIWVAVEVVSGEEVLARNTVAIKPVEPLVSIYENNPLYGFMFHQATSNNYRLKEGEVTFTAFPYFFSTNTRLNNNITYEWRTNTGGLETRDSVTYRAPDNTSGSSQVSLRAFRKNQITQDAHRSFLVEFGP